VGYHWDGLYYASDYFDQLYEWAIQLIKAGKAYVEDFSVDEIREYRGTLTRLARRVRLAAALFHKISIYSSTCVPANFDMASPNLNMRDPVMYRILHAERFPHRNKWCIYPMYDYAHGHRIRLSASRIP
jgi:glutaminyl-tRNA synthetase